MASVAKRKRRGYCDLRRRVGASGGRWEPGIARRVFRVLALVDAKWIAGKVLVSLSKPIQRIEMTKVVDDFDDVGVLPELAQARRRTYVGNVEGTVPALERLGLSPALFFTNR